jgi:hypothetical protein
VLSIQRGIRRGNAVSRREFLRVGGLGAAGLALPDLLRAREARASRPAGPRPGTFGRARACIILFMDGGPPQMDTFDLKPDAPAEVRGEFKPIATNVPGIRISEHFPRIARHADKLALVRSVHIGSDVHEVGTYAMLTGTQFTGTVVPDATKETPEDTPSIGSVMARLRGGGTLPPYVWMPFIWKGYPIIAQGYGGFLGRAYDPFRILQDPNAPGFQVEALTLPGDVPLERLGGRRGLVDAVGRQAGQAPGPGPAARWDAHYRKALDVIASPLARRAFDLGSEDVRVRDRYGRHTFGQCALLARRLVEHGVPLVTVYYHDFTQKDPGFTNWDTHQKNYPVLKDTLMPAADRAFPALLEDLEGRGLLEETLVVWMGDFGRTPKINPAGGRDHWGGCCCVLFAGAGIRTGQVYGSSDPMAAYPKDNPVSPGEVVATIYHCLGVDPHLELPDPFGRPMRICNGEPIRALLG